MNICFFGASSDDIAASYMQATEGLGRLLGGQGYDLVYGGGRHGLMGAFARGLKSQGGRVTSVYPPLFDKPGIIFEATDIHIVTADLASRKQKMEQLADAYVIAPGSVGTFDELFDIYAQKKLGYTAKPIALFNIDGFYDGLMAFLASTAAAGFMEESCLGMVSCQSAPQGVADYLAAGLGRGGETDC